MSLAAETKSEVAEPREAIAPADASVAPAAAHPWLWPAIVTAIGIVAIYATAANFRWTSGPEASPYAGDFLQEWIGGYVVRAGDHARFYDPAYAQELEHDPRICPQEWQREEYLPLVYPPFYYAVISPLSYLPLMAAAWVWAGLMVAALVGGVVLLARGGNEPRRKFAAGYFLSASDDSSKVERCLPWLLPAALLFLPVVESLISSQKGTVCLLIVAATYVLLRGDRPFWAGVVFGLLAFKPQLALVIGGAMLIAGQWRFVAGAVTSVSALVAISLAVGLDVCRQYVDFAQQAGEYMRTAGYDLHKSHTWAGFIALLFGDRPSLLGTALTVAGVLATLALCGKLLWGGVDPSSRRFDRQFAGLVLATVLLSPHLFTYDLAMLLVPIVLLGRPLLEASDAAPSTDRTTLRWLLIGIFFVPALSVSLAAKTGLQISVPLFLGLLAFVATKSEEAGEQRLQAVAG